MSNHYRLTFNLVTADREIAQSALADVARTVDEKCIVERLYVTKFAPEVFGGTVTFIAENMVEAAGLAEQIKRLPGLPPMDTVKVGLR